MLLDHWRGRRQKRGCRGPFNWMGDGHRDSKCFWALQLLQTLCHTLEVEDYGAGTLLHYLLPDCLSRVTDLLP